MATNDFVPVCTDDWYTRRRQDDEGNFFRRMATAAGRKGDGGDTRQGIYVFAADGTVLGFKNAGHDPKVMKKVFVDALAKFQQLPEAQRSAGKIRVPAHGEFDPKYTRQLPKDGLVLRTHARILEKKGDTYQPGTCELQGGDKASRDYVWFTKEEVATLLPSVWEVGHNYPVPEKLTQRLARFHYIDNTRGEPQFWKKSEIRDNQMSLSVIAVSPEQVELQLTATVTLATKADLAKADRGFEAQSIGWIKYNRTKKEFEQFDVASIGLHWGDHFHNGTARPGRNPLGLWWTLADLTKPGNTIWPQGIRDKDPYMKGD